MTTPAIEYEQPQPTLGTPKKKRRDREAQIETPEQAQAFEQSQAIHELNTRIGNYSPAFITDHPHVVAHQVFSSISTAKIRALGPYLSQSWADLKSANSYAGVPGGLITARVDALQTQDPEARRLKLALLELLAQQSPDDQQAIAALIRAQGLRQGFENPDAPTPTEQIVQEGMTPLAREQYQAEGQGNAVLQGLGEAGNLGLGVSTILHHLAQTQRDVYGIPQSSADAAARQRREDKDIQTARDKLSELEALPDLAAGLKARGLSQGVIADALQGRHDATAHLRDITEAIITARERWFHVDPMQGLATIRSTAQRIAGAVPVGTVKVGWTGEGVEIQTNDTSSPDAILATAAAQTMFPGAKTSYVSSSMITQAVGDTLHLVQQTLTGLMLPLTGISKIIPPARYALEVPAEFLGRIGADAGGTVAHLFGVQPTDPLYEQFQNAAALLVQIEGLKLGADLGAAVKLGRATPTELLAPDIAKETLATAARTALGAPDFRSMSLKKLQTEAKTRGIEPEQPQADLVKQLEKAVPGLSAIKTPAEVLRKRLGGHIIGRLSAGVAQLVSTPIEKWYTDTGMGKRVVRDMARVNAEHGANAYGELVRQLKVDPATAKLVAGEADPQVLVQLLTDRLKGVDYAQVKTWQARMTELQGRLASTDLAPDERGAAGSEIAQLRQRIQAMQPDKLDFDIPRRSLKRRLFNKAPRILASGKLSRFDRILSALVSPESVFGLFGGKGVPVGMLKEFDEATGKERRVLARKALRLVSLREVVDEGSHEAFYNRFTGNIPDADALNIETAQRRMRRAGVKPEVIRRLLSNYSRTVTPSEMFAWMGKVHEAIGESPYVARDMANYVGSWSDRQATQVGYGRWHEQTTGELTGGAYEHSHHILTGKDGQPLPYAEAQFADVFPLRSMNTLIDATSLTRTLVRAGRRQYREVVTDKFGKPVVDRETGKPKYNWKFVPKSGADIPKSAGAIVARAALLPYDVLKAVASLGTAILKAPVLVTRVLGALPLRIQPDQMFRNYVGGLSPLVGEAFRRGADERFFAKPGETPAKGKITLPDIGVLTNIAMTDITKTEKVIAEVDTTPFGPGRPPTEEVLAGLARHIDIARSSPAIRRLAMMGPEEFRSWLDTEAGTFTRDRSFGYLAKDLQVPEGADPYKVWADNAYRHLREITGGNDRLMRAIAGTQRWDLRSARTADQVAANLADVSTVEQYRALVEEEQAISTRIREETRLGNPTHGLLDSLATVIGDRTSIEESTPLATRHASVNLSDSDALQEAIAQAIDDGDYTLPASVEVERLAQKRDPGFYGQARQLGRSWSNFVYKGLKPLSAVDVRTARGSHWYQMMRQRFGEAVARGVPAEEALNLAVWRAARDTSAVMYDLAARSSFHRFFQNVFWFLPAFQEVLETWLWKMPSRFYHPIGMAYLVGSIHAFLQYLHKEGVIRTLPLGPNGQETDVVTNDGIKDFINKIAPGTPLQVATGDHIVRYFYPTSINLVTSGGLNPGLSTPYSEGLAVLAQTHGSMWRGLGDALLPYGFPSIAPSGIDRVTEAATGQPSVFERFGVGFKTQQDRYNWAFDDALASAWGLLRSEGWKIPDQRQFKGKNAAHNYHAAYETAVTRLMDEASHIQRSRTWTLAASSALSPVSWHQIDSARADWERFWRDEIMKGQPPPKPGEPYTPLTEKQRNLIEGYLKVHPDSIAYRTWRSTAAGTVSNPIPGQEDDRAFGQFLSDNKRVLPPDEFIATVVASNEFRHVSNAIQEALQEVSPKLSAPELLAQGFARHGALYAIQAQYDRWKSFNRTVGNQPGAADVFDAHIRAWDQQSSSPIPVQTFQNHQMSDLATKLNEASQRFSFHGMPLDEFTRFRADVEQLLNVTYGPPTTTLQKDMAWYFDKVQAPYYKATGPKYAEATSLSNSGLKDQAGAVFSELRATSNAWDGKVIMRDGKKVTLTTDQSLIGRKGYYPSPELVSWGNLSPKQQELRTLRWISQPTGWLSDFQRRTAGFNDDPKYDPMFAAIEKFQQQTDAGLRKAGLSPSSKAYQAVRTTEENRILAWTEQHYGADGLHLWKLSQSAPYVRIAWVAKHSGSLDIEHNPIWTWAVTQADAIAAAGQKLGFSVTGNGQTMDSVRNQFFPMLAELQTQGSDLRAKAVGFYGEDAVKQFDTFMDKLGIAVAPKGVAFVKSLKLYDGTFFNQFSTQFIPDNPKPFVLLAEQDVGQVPHVQKTAPQGAPAGTAAPKGAPNGAPVGVTRKHWQTAGQLFLAAARASGVSDAVSWVQDPRFWYIMGRETGLTPEASQAETQRSAVAQNPHSTAFGIGQFLDSTWGTVGGTKTSDPYTQMGYVFLYLKRHYGTLAAAYAHDQATGWY